MWRCEDWQHLFQEQPPPYPAWWQDPRHVALQHQLVMACSQHIEHVLEVGCFQGASTSAYVQAMRDGAGITLACCDIAITPELRDTVARAPRPVELLEMDSVFAIKPGYDTIVLDGHHCLEVVTREIGLCLAYETPTILLHDTHIGSQGFEGPAWALAALRESGLYQCVWDAKRRQGEYTHRGFAVCSRVPEVFRTARQLMRDL